MSVIENLEPKNLWKYFDEISKIPRCSKHEERIIDFILNFAKKHGLKVKTDTSGNIIVLKPASTGMDTKSTVILQGHLDMVCEKNSEVEHDFTRDPIKLKRNGDILTADGTTLGADNGIGIAAVLAILQDPTLKHGPIEALFTVDEETGLTGAFAMKSDFLTGRIMLNLDSEDFGVITVGCAGGGESKIELSVKTQSLGNNLENMTIKIFGLRGGHSGCDIHEQRGNAIKILSRILWKAFQSYDFFISDIKGGDKHNAIPREAFAQVSINKADKNKLISDLKAEEEAILEEIKSIDPKFKLEIQTSGKPDKTLNRDSQVKLLNLLHGLPHGVHKMNYDIPELVETSTNLATVTLKANTVIIGMSSRSSIKSALQNLRDQIHAIAILSGAQVTEDAPYPGWKPNLNSKLLALSKKIFIDLYKKEPKIEAIHAGLECGIIGEKFIGMDMISLGPTIKYPHSPEEQVHIDSVNKFYKFVLTILEHI